MADQNLTGIWQGLYSYEGLGPHVGFTATLIDATGTIHGTTHEVDPAVFAGQLDATVSGARSGGAVRFTKTYEAGDERLVPVAYDGRLSGDGQEIEGTWSLRASDQVLSGRFLMSRPERRTAEIRLAETIRL